MSRFGGPYLAGETFTATDAFFAPVAFRVQSYGLVLDPVAAGYVTHLLDLSSMRSWYADALNEKFRDEPHEREIREQGTVQADFRAA